MFQIMIKVRRMRFSSHLLAERLKRICYLQMQRMIKFYQHLWILHLLLLPHQQSLSNLMFVDDSFIFWVIELSTPQEYNMNVDSLQMFLSVFLSDSIGQHLLMTMVYKICFREWFVCLNIIVRFISRLGVSIWESI